MRSDQVTRRGLLAGGALAAAGRAWADPFGLPVGVQLWAVKAELDRDFDGTLRRIHAIGYGRVEAAGYHGRSAEAFRAAVAGAGLTCGGALAGMADMLKDPAPARSATPATWGWSGWSAPRRFPPGWSPPPIRARTGSTRCAAP